MARQREELPTYVTPNKSHLLQNIMRLLMGDLTRTGAVIELLVGPGRPRLLVAVDDALVGLLRHWPQQITFDAVDLSLGLTLHARIERVRLRL